MGIRPVIRAARAALLLLAAGCHLPAEDRSDSSAPAGRAGFAPGTLVPLAPLAAADLAAGRPEARASRPLQVTVARSATPAVPPPGRAPAVPVPLPTVPAAVKAAEALTSTAPPPAPASAQTEVPSFPPPEDLNPQWVAAGSIRAATGAPQKLRPPVLIRDDEPPLARPALPQITEPPGSPPARPVSGAAPAGGAQPKPVPPGEFLPPIPVLPETTPAPKPAAPPAALPAPATLPPLAVAPVVPPAAGPIELNGNPVTFDALSKLVDGNICSSCGGPLGAGGCATCGGDCGGPQCRAGGRRCEPFPAHTAVGRALGLVYSSVCCPDPCYQPRWEPIANAAFFVDAVRPKTSTTFRWDYANHYIYPDRGEYLFARADGKGRGPKANAPLLAIPYVDYHELYLITEVATGAAGVQIAVPYRSVNATPFGQDGAGFADMQITAKTMLLDSELALFGFQMRTYVPIGQTGKGLGTGHVSLEPGLNFGLRCAPETYLQAQVVEWIPLGGDKDYQGAHLRWGASLNQVLWRPIRDVQLIGTLETTGISFQDGLFTDPELGSMKLTKRTAAHVGAGLRMFFCDTLDFGLGWQHGVTGKYLARDFTRFEVRYRF